MSTASETQTIRTACNRDCPDACGIIATVENDRVVRIQGDPDHPITQGFLCYRTSRFLDRQYDPSRLMTPLIRRDGVFEPATWDEALTLIVEKMTTIKAESGGAAIMHYRCGGSLGIMKLITDYFFECFGPVTIKSGDICAGAGEAAQIKDFGEFDSSDFFDLRNSKSVIIWGKNVYVSQVHLLPLLKEIRKNGTRLILIDPIHHRTADLCDQFVQPRPGGDAALALGMARVLFDKGLFDPLAPEYCNHFDEFGATVESKTLEEWSSIADVPVETIDELAETYADRPSAILVGWGMQRRTNGSAAIRTVDALGAISGNLGIPGGGVSFYFKRRGAFDLSFIQGAKVAPRTIPETLLGPGILEASEPPMRMVWVDNANPVAMLPESKTVKQALESREFTVVVDSFLTDTAQCADVVLPTTTMLEDNDLMGAYGHHWLVESQPVVAPPEGVLTDYEIMQQLAQRVQLDKRANGDFGWDVERWKTCLLSRVAEQGASLEQLRLGAVRNPQAPSVLFPDKKFATENGRANLIHEIAFEPPAVSEQRPMLLSAMSTEKAQASQWADPIDGPLEATVHPNAAHGFADGELARVQSEHGEITVRLNFDDRQRTDMLVFPKGGHFKDGNCANALIKAQETDDGGCAAYYDTPVCLLPLE
ncbi:MAG: molybdopterin-containing oxidoreductase catalytic subunit [Planctomycetaceae bacterium]|nr:molybdopterin-containing oxidoreductase catalytic subunit [Planctomycetaceae bacterium]